LAEGLREVVRVRRWKVERGRRGADSAGVEVRRPGGEVAPQPQQFRRRHRLAGRRKAEVAQSRRVGVESQDFCRGRGALQRQAVPQRPGVGRAAAQEGIEQGEAGSGREQGTSPALPIARAQDGRADGDGKVCRARGLYAFCFVRAPLGGGAAAAA
jgi:hypothetical protein